MKHVGVRSDPKDIASQEQLGGGTGDFKKDGSVAMTGAFNHAPASAASSGSAMTIAALPSNTIVVTGSPPISVLGTLPAGVYRRIIIGSPTPPYINNNVNLILFGGDIKCSEGDTALFLSQGAGIWKCVDYTKKDGTSLVAFQGGDLTKALNLAPPIALASAGNTYIGDVDSNQVTITGTTKISGFGSGYKAGISRILTFTTALTLQHSATGLVLPGTADIVTAPGDTAEFVSTGSGAIWKCLWYERADGTALVSSSFSEAQVRATPMTGVAFTDKTPVVAADTLLAAVGKLQAQLSAGVFRTETITTTSVGQTSYAVPNGYTVGSIVAFFNGVLLAPADYTATDGTNVVLASGALTTSDIMSVLVIGSVRAQDDALLQYTVAALPAASANAFKQRWCTNMAGGAGVVVSNGTNWLRVADNTVVTT